MKKVKEAFYREIEEARRIDEAEILFSILRWLASNAG
jgi:hypothetical protein